MSTFAPNWEYISPEEVEVKVNSEGPLPYLKEFSFDGKLQIGWTSDMLKLEDAARLPQQKVIIPE